jgi:hypothetical protein
MEPEQLARLHAARAARRAARKGGDTVPNLSKA